MALAQLDDRINNCSPRLELDELDDDEDDDEDEAAVLPLLVQFGMRELAVEDVDAD